MKINAVSIINKDKRSSLEIKLLDNHIIIDSNKVPISEFIINVGGSRSELFFLKNDRYSFYIRKSRSISNYFKKSSHKELNDLYKKSTKEKSKELIIITSFIIICLLIIIVPLNHQERITSFIVSKIPYSLEQKLSDDIFKRFLNKDYSNDDIKTLKAIKKITQPLLHQVPKEYQDIKFYISNSSEVNAYALIGGHITLTKGFLKKVDNCNEFYGVIGHELAHITKRHGLKSLFKSATLFGGVSLLFGDLSGIAAIIVQNSSKLYNLSFSREYEREADKISLKYTSKIGYSADGLVHFLEKIDNDNTKEKIIDERVQNFLSTHPMEKNRIERLKDLSQRLTLNKVKSQCDYLQIKKLLK